jgi:hypothetical protein
VAKDELSDPQGVQKMKIDSIGVSQKSYTPTPKNTAPITPDATTGAPKEKSEKTPGVVRLIEEGHFKPTADVRLRLNFAEHLDTSTPLVPAEGVHGKGYAKFLAIYQDRYNQSAPINPEPDPAPPIDTVDTVASDDTTDSVDMLG